MEIPQQSLNETCTEQPNEQTPIKWTIREKLYLISSVLLHGDSNWSFISEQLNKWLKSTLNCSHSNTLTLRTSTQCAKQYKFLTRAYASRFGFPDLKKIHGELFEERQKELSSLTTQFSEQYDSIYKEIEHILEMDSSSFDQLAEMYLANKKSNESSTNKTGKNSNDKQTNASTNEEDLLFETNLGKIFEFKKRKKEKEEEEEKKRRDELEREAAELAAAAAVVAAAASASAEVNQTSLRMSIEQETHSSNTNQELNQEQEIINTDKINELVEVEDKKPDMFELTESTANSDLASNIESKTEPIVAVVEIKIEADANTPKIDKNLEIIDLTTKSVESVEQESPVPQEVEVVTSKAESEPNNVEQAEAVINEETKSVEKKQLDADLVSAEKEESPTKLSPETSNEPLKPTIESEQDEKLNEPLKASEENKEKKEKSCSWEEDDDRFSSEDDLPLVKLQPKRSVETAKMKSDDEEIVEDKIEDASVVTTTEVEKESIGSIRAARRSLTKIDEVESRPVIEMEISQEKEEKVVAMEEVDDVKSEKSEEPVKKGRKSSLKEKKPKRVARKSSSEESVESSATAASTKEKKNSTASMRRRQSRKSSSNCELPLSPGVDAKPSGLVSIKSEPIQISSVDAELKMNEDTQLNLAQPNDAARAKCNQDSAAPFSSLSTASNLSTNSSSSNNNGNNKQSDEEKAYRAWKKAIMMVLNNISCHKHATIFMHPVKDDIAPGYSNVVNRPMDLTTIKKNIENGSIKSTKVFQRDIMLMFTNAIMYNSSNHEVNKISVEMYKEVLNDVEQLLHAQESMNEEPAKSMRFRETRSSTNSEKGIEIDKIESNESNSESAVVGILMATNKTLISENKDELLETASLNSCSTLSIPNKSVSRAKAKQDNSVSSVSTSATTNSKKRRLSNDTTPNQQQTPPSQQKSKKRRKSGR